MKRPTALDVLIGSAALLCAAFELPPALAQTTSFTYQGRVEDGGVPADGPHDFRFRLFDATMGGIQVGSMLCVDDVDVVDGVFTVQLDFGPQFATTAQRHLEIDVRRDTGLPCVDATGFVVLAPRQQITATPIASHANSAFALDAADGSPTNAVFVNDAGQVGVGTTSPQDQLHVNGGIRWGGGATNYTYSGIDGSGLFLEQKANSSATSRIRVQSSKAGDQLNYSQFFVDPYAGFSFVGFGSGNTNVGIGTATPVAKLDVRGDIRLGSSGQFHAPSGEEKLRILRGRVASNGGIVFGSGFTASRTSAGVYLISFSTSFASTPVVTVSASVGAFDGPFIAMTNGVTTAAAGIRITNGGGTSVDDTFEFIAIGPR